jgi:hypothetical protein
MVISSTRNTHITTLLLAELKCVNISLLANIGACDSLEYLVLPHPSRQYYIVSLLVEPVLKLSA